MVYIIVLLLGLGLAAFIAHLQSHLRKKAMIEKTAASATAVGDTVSVVVRGRFRYYDRLGDTHRCYVYTGTEGGNYTCESVDCDSNRYRHYCSDYPTDNWPNAPGQQLQ